LKKPVPSAAVIAILSNRVVSDIVLAESNGD
jgi:hypothetical protein